MLIRFGTVKVRKYEGEEDHSVEIEKLFARFKQAEIPKDQFHEAKRDAYAEHVEANILELVKKWYPEVFRQLDEYCERYEHCIDPVLFQFSREIQFYVLRRQHDKRALRMIRWATAPSFTLHPRDDNGMNDLSGKIDCAIAQITNTLWKSALHVEQFFGLLKHELAFYIGCINLRDQLEKRGLAIAIPNVTASPKRILNGEGLYDCSLALVKTDEIVKNPLVADGRNLIIISGANQGGKSTFLRSLGQAQLMAQCGMFVCAASLNIDICKGVYSHFKREEDTKLESGKLDEELSRMSLIVDRLRPGSLLLCNESFSSTNEREGSEIHRQIVDALLECGVRVVSVSHMYEFVISYYQRKREDMLFLQPQRIENGERTFRLVSGVPTPTSYGDDIYRSVFEG